MTRPGRVLVIAGVIAGLVGAPAARALDPTRIEALAVPAARDTEPVVLSGALFAGWAAPADVSVKLPTTGGLQCLADDQAPECTHSRYEEPEVSTGDALGTGVPVDRLLGYRWNGRGFVQIPFQVDEVATRYLTNNASGFAFYSETDAHPTYVWDEERFRWTASAPGQPCVAAPAGGVRTTPDSVAGLDTNDELSFMASDAGAAAPSSAKLPGGIAAMKRVTIADPYDATHLRYVYVMRTTGGAGAPKAAFTASNGYVRYEPDADSNTFVYSQSSYGDYGNAAKGAYLDTATGKCMTKPADAKQRRPKDTAWIKTPRYAFRYDGRWLMTQLRVTATDKPWTYGPDIIDQWKARAFQQRPGGETPCCGYEDEAVNWGGSSITMGVRAGPVRVIRSTWGADSGTNVNRTEVFYRDEFRQDAYLRVHPIPPFDGIYSQWDYNGGKVWQYFNPYVPDGVVIDGKNDEAFGNYNAHIGPDGVRFQGKTLAGDPGTGSCDSDVCLDNDFDVVDPTVSGPTGALSYEQITGPYGTLVSRYSIKQPTAGTAHALVTTPYYRDDSCFDDGTGTDPGSHLNPRHTDPVVDSHGKPRRCWTPADGDPDLYPDDHFFQGDVGTVGIHVLLVAESDNAMQTVPLTEIDSEQRVVLLPGLWHNVGEQYGRGTEKPLVAFVG
ncbi:MAG TPA: hypothetical protein VFB78_10505 [Acidimicrobiales bacterium]|nr:hypothetical protein [Acidimicrobiales bacterium]